MPTKTVGGKVNAKGQPIGPATGYRSMRAETGRYIIVFDPPFKDLHGFAATQIFGQEDGSTLDNVVVQSIDGGEVQLKTGDSSGHMRDRDFTFVAYGDVA